MRRLSGARMSLAGPRSLGHGAQPASDPVQSGPSATSGRSAFQSPTALGTSNVCSLSPCEEESYKGEPGAATRGVLEGALTIHTWGPRSNGFLHTVAVFTSGEFYDVGTSS